MVKLLFCTSYKPGALLIRIATMSRFSHVAIEVDNILYESRFATGVHKPFSDNVYDPASIVSVYFNKAENNIFMPRQHAFSTVVTLAGGSTTETITLPIPSAFFADKPTCVSASIQNADSSFLVVYDYDSVNTTSDQIVLIVSDKNGNVLPSGIRRFFVSCYGD